MENDTPGGSTGPGAESDVSDRLVSIVTEFIITQLSAPHEDSGA